MTVCKSLFVGWFMEQSRGVCGGAVDWFVADGCGGLRGLKNSLAASDCLWRNSFCAAIASLYVRIQLLR